MCGSSQAYFNIVHVCMWYKQWMHVAASTHVQFSLLHFYSQGSPGNFFPYFYSMCRDLILSNGGLDTTDKEAMRGKGGECGVALVVLLLGPLFGQLFYYAFKPRATLTIRCYKKCATYGLLQVLIFLVVKETIP